MFEKNLAVCFTIALLFTGPAHADETDQVLWQEYIDLLGKANQVQAHSTIQQDPARAAQYMFMSLGHAYTLITRSNPDYPEFVPYINHVYNIAGPNPDTTYRFVTIDGNNTYRVFGHRGSVHMIDFQIGYDFMGFAEKPGKTLVTQRIDALAIDDDGRFEIILSTEKPAGYEGNWIPLDERANYLLVRQVVYAPDEVNARMAIENLSDAPYKAPAIDADRAIRGSIEYARLSAIQFLSFLKPLAANEVINRFEIPDWSSVGGFKDQTYIHGLYDVPEDEALVVNFKLPEACHYWNIQATDRLWQTLDFMRGQSHLNGHLDRADSDGMIRIVLSHKDPGNQNWIDLNDIQHGYILIRTMQCDPEIYPSAERVSIAEVDEYLPEDTKRVSLDERRATQRAYSSALQIRNNW